MENIEEKPNYYAIIPANIRYDNNLKANEKLLYGEITALCSATGECWASNEYFANLYNKSKDTISDWVSNLKKNGYINIEIIRNLDTKEIIKRIIMINTLSDKSPIGYREKHLEGIGENTLENNTSNNITSIYSSSVAEDFDKIWKLYPRKTNKNSAFRHYKAWLVGKNYAGKRIKLTNKQMWIATKKYADLVKEEKREEQYIKMGSTFFNEAIMEYVEEENKNG